MYICIQLVEKNQEYRICNRCIMDTTDPVIRFDDQGNCNHCTEFLETRSRYSYQGEQSDVALASLIHEIKRKGKGRPYDCIVGLSGGVDSSYTAWKAKELGLRVLAVHLDNGWNSIEANQNIRSIANKLAIDYETEVLDWEEFKQIQPRKTRKGDRLFRVQDIELLKQIHFLLREKKYSIDGAKTYLKNNKGKAEKNIAVLNSLKNLKSFLITLKENL